MEKIKFSEFPWEYFNGSEFVGHLSEVNGEEDLFNKLSLILEFPNYFGYNWNAVYDCLRDFHWIENKGIVLVHDKMPILDEPVFKIYIQVLIEAAQDWKEGEEHYFGIVFPKDGKELVEKTITGCGNFGA